MRGFDRRLAKSGTEGRRRPGFRPRGGAGLRVAVMAVLTLAVWPVSSAVARQSHSFAVEGFGGWAGFTDNATRHHRAFGGGARIDLTPSLAVGPEVVFMRGPGTDRDLLLTGNLTWQFPGSGASRTRIHPYLVVGGGVFRHSEQVRGGRYASTEGAFTAGGGVRAFVTDRIYVAPEVRVGWELHVRAGVGVGIRF